MKNTDRNIIYGFTLRLEKHSRLQIFISDDFCNLTFGFDGLNRPTDYRNLINTLSMHCVSVSICVSRAVYAEVNILYDLYRRA